MIPLLTPLQLEQRRAPNTLPLKSGSTQIDTDRIQLVLEESTGIIVAQLPWLLDDTGEIKQPVSPQFASALEGICADIAYHRLTDTVSSSEDDRAWYRDSVKLLEKIDREYQGGLSGPGTQESCVVIPSLKDGIEDHRFYKKGRIF